jgi:hypothetical protein
MVPDTPLFTSPDLTAAATITTVLRGPDEIVAQEGRNLCWRKTPDLEKVLADLGAGRIVPDPTAVERQRKVLRARAVFVVASSSKRGGA